MRRTVRTLRALGDHFLEARADGAILALPDAFEQAQDGLVRLLRDRLVWGPTEPRDVRGATPGLVDRPR